MHAVPIGYDYNQVAVALGPADRFKHLAVFGKPGVGKSTLLANMIAADLVYGAGLTVIDPHGSLIADILEIIPKSRTNDVIYLNPWLQAGRVVGLNLLEVSDDHQKPLVVSSLISIFKNLWPDGWGPRSEFILSNAAYTLLSQRQPGTLLSVQKLLTDLNYRKQLLHRIKDPAVQWFFNLYDRQWTKSFREEAIAPLLNKVNKFVTSPLLRPMLGQQRSGFDFRKVLDERKILLCDLPKGGLGPDVSQLIGSIIVTKLALVALSRQDTPEEQRVPHFLYADEIQNFVYGMDLPTILAEARKYRLGLNLATQTLGTLPKATTAAILGNCATIISFRVSAEDAAILEQEFSRETTATALQSPSDHEIYLKTLVDGGPSEPQVLRTFGPAPKQAESGNRETIIRTSMNRYGQPRATIEAKLKAFLAPAPQASRSQRPVAS